MLAVVLGAVDGDSVRLRALDGHVFIARVGGVDAPSTGARAQAALRLIQTWVGRRVQFRETCCGRPHAETPGTVVDSNTGENLGEALIAAGVADRMPSFPIKAQ